MSGDWVHPSMASAGVTTPMVRCRCGRQKQPSEMLEVRTLGVGTDYLCGPCTEDLFRKEVVDRLTFHGRAGAPPGWIAAYAAKLAAGPLTRSGLPVEIRDAIRARGGGPP